MGEAISLGARAILPALASVSALLDAAWKAALPGRARLGVGEEAHHTGAAVDLFAQALEPVGALPMLVVSPWQACLRRQAMDGESPLAVPTRPNRQALGTHLARSRSRKPTSRRASYVSLRSERPAELLRGSRRPPCGAGGVPGVTQEVHVGALPGSLGQHLAHGFFEACMVVGDHQLHPGKPTLFQAYCLDTHRKAHCLDTQRVVHLRGRASRPPSRHALHHGTPCPHVSVGAGRDHGTPCSITGRHAPIGGMGDACVAHVACDVVPAR